MQVTGIYSFDEADADLSLLPMAARRALDCAGLHLSLQGWQLLPVAERGILVRLGAADVVDDSAVARCLAGSAKYVQRQAPLCEAVATAGPSTELLQALPDGHGLTLARWCRLSALDRYVLTQLVRRGKWERLARAYAEISTGVVRSV